MNFIPQNLAAMHALPIAIRLTKPEIFEKTFRPHFKPIDMNYIDPKILPKVSGIPCATFFWNNSA